MRKKSWGSQSAISVQCGIVLTLLLLSGIFASSNGAARRPPGQIELYHQLFPIVHSLTSFPFTMFPALGNADKDKFMADDLINQDELIHTTAFLKGQLRIRILFSQDTVKELQDTINACDFLLWNFQRIATERDVLGNLAIGAGDIERLFALRSERARSKAERKSLYRD